jgi:hypothetical protein
MSATEFNQLWGTFSVRDHLPKGAFLSEVLLYDRLVIPVPPKNDPAEWDRWANKEKWDPLRQSKILDCLEGIAEKVEWTAEWEAEWRLNWNQSRRGVTEQVAKELAYQWTGKGLLKAVPAYAKGVVAASSYKKLADVQKELGIQRTPPGVKLPPGVISVVIGQEFLVPRDPAIAELDLLGEAAGLARDPEFRRKRAAYNKWLQGFLDDKGMTDAVSVKRAVEQMSDLVADQRSLVRNKKIWKGVKVAFVFAQVAVGVAFAPVLPIAIGSAALSIGAFTVSEKLSALNRDFAVPAAAVLLDAQRRLDLTSAR